MADDRAYDLAPSGIFTQFTFYSILVPGLFATAMITPILPWKFFVESDNIIPILLWFSLSFLAGTTFYIFSNWIEIKVFDKVPSFKTPTDRLFEKLTLKDDPESELSREVRKNFVKYWQPKFDDDDLFEVMDDDENPDDNRTDTESRSLPLTEPLRIYYKTLKVALRPLSPMKFIGKDDGKNGGQDEEDGENGRQDEEDDENGEQDEKKRTVSDAMYRLTLSEVWEQRNELPSTLVHMYFFSRSVLVQALFFAVFYAVLLASYYLVIFWDLESVFVSGYNPIFSEIGIKIPLFALSLLLVLVVIGRIFRSGYRRFGEYYIKYLIVSGAERYENPTVPAASPSTGFYY